MQETEEIRVQSLGWEGPLEESLAACSHILAWRIPWTEEPAAAAAAKSLQLCLTVRDPMDCSLPGSSVYGIFQAGVLEWVDIAFSDRGAWWATIHRVTKRQT